MRILVKSALISAVVLFIIILITLLYAWPTFDERPELARGLSSNFEEGEIQFNARLAERFPIGTAENRMIATLQDQGFEVFEDDFGTYANHEAPQLVCKLITRVNWTSDNNGRLTSMSGVYGAACP